MRAWALWNMGSDLASEESLRHKKNLAALSTGAAAIPLRGIKSMSIDGEILRLHERFKRGEVSPVDIARAHLDAIGRLNPGVNAFALVDDCVALEMARASEARYRRGEALGPLDGVPITIKDTLNVAGWPTRAGIAHDVGCRGAARRGLDRTASLGWRHLPGQDNDARIRLERADRKSGRRRDLESA